MVTLFLLPLGVGILFVIMLVLRAQPTSDDNGALVQWSLILLGALLAWWVVALLFNFAIFAPAFWLIGKLESKRTRAAKKPPEP